ncbi:MAG: hypothetical protein OXT65_10015 [Alphaproteobacteria bacterium]|nr:hypothetical protein [Alphaproteobacteria bacterium]
MLKKVFNRFTLRCFGAAALGVLVMAGAIMGLAAWGDYEERDDIVQAVPQVVFPESIETLEETANNILRAEGLADIAPAAGDAVEEEVSD